MSLNMYLGEVQSQTQSMNAICNTTIQSMEQAIQSIDAFAIDTVLQGQTYSSAKAYLVQTFRPLAQGIICLCEELIRQNEAFPNDFQAKVASTDVIEHEIRQQIQEINQSIASIEAIEVLTPMPGVDAIIAVLIAMRKKLEEKLERLYEFNHSSSNNYSTALQLAASITAGLAEVQSGKGFSPVSGTFHSEKLNMEWAKQIQIIIEEKIRKSDNGIGKSVDLEHNVYNDIEGISSENQSINNRFTKEEIQATQKYLEGIKNGTIKGNIGEDFQVETDDYEMEHNIFGQPVGGRRPVLDPFLIGVAKFGFDFLFGDLFTLFDPEATYGEKLLAVGMMTPYGKGVKIVDKLHGLKKVGDVKKATSGSAGVAKGTGEATPKKKSVPDWLKERWEAGNNFNKENRPRYPYNEVELEAKEVGGKKYVVDSYAHNKEIVSRKFTQLSEVQEKTAKSYLNEITKKYPSGSKISNGPFNPNALKGGRLKGELILEVPVQNKPIPQTILDEATKNRIIIRDIKGKVYN
ncbi:T7SS effector LXG polymorphic toxin [Bacillus albus]|nr:T7SS effector LXG polymorphic toxin [Bacillus albus]WJE68510.1 T7SS effector LXG polymorphic toxin [Bacillus albus]